MIKTLNALAETNRFNMVELLQAGPHSVGEIVSTLQLPQPQVSKHLRILMEAGLVEVEREAQRRIYRLRPEPFLEMGEWLDTFRQAWEQRLDRLDTYLKELQEKETSPENT
jgi:DNA-binding transcriptional ArsR family regulator